MWALCCICVLFACLFRRPLCRPHRVCARVWVCEPLSISPTSASRVFPLLVVRSRVFSFVNRLSCSRAPILVGITNWTVVLCTHTICSVCRHKEANTQFARYACRMSLAIFKFEFPISALSCRARGASRRRALRSTANSAHFTRASSAQALAKLTAKFGTVKFAVIGDGRRSSVSVRVHQFAVQSQLCECAEAAWKQCGMCRRTEEPHN